MHDTRLRKFHTKHDFPLDVNLAEVAETRPTRHSLHAAAKVVNALAAQWEGGRGEDLAFDIRLIRAHLILEEVGEAMEALATGDEVALLDALADIDYVVHGCAVTFGLPLDAAAEEVHRSNMTKKITGEKRLRDKGPDYEPPDIAQVIAEHRDVELRAQEAAYQSHRADIEALDRVIKMYTARGIPTSVLWTIREDIIKENQ